MPEELWMEVCNIVQEAVTKTIPKKNPRRQNGCLRRYYKQLRREVKGKEKMERYTQLNAEFQRLAKRDKKTFKGGQCKEIEENNRLGKLEVTSRKLEISMQHFIQR